MQLHGIGWVFLGGMGGPVLLELVKLAGWRDGAVIKQRYNSGKYWIGLAAVFILAGAVAVLKCGASASLLDAIHFGIAAPAIINGYASATVTRMRLRNPLHLSRLGGSLSWREAMAY